MSRIKRRAYEAGDVNALETVETGPSLVKWQERLASTRPGGVAFTFLADGAVVACGGVWMKGEETAVRAWCMVQRDLPLSLVRGLLAEARRILAKFDPVEVRVRAGFEPGLRLVQHLGFRECGAESDGEGHIRVFRGAFR